MPTYRPTRPGAARLPRGERAGLRRPRRLRRRPRRCNRACLRQLLSQRFADERFCRLDQTTAADQAGAGRRRRTAATTRTATASRTRPSRGRDHEGLSTSHLTAADRWGNVVTYTLTIEQTGGSALTVPGRGFLLNNELTDFDLGADLGHRAERARRRASGPASLDVADDRHRPRPTGAGHRLAGRLDDHHHRAAGAARPPRLRHVPAAGGRRPAGQPAQHRRRAGRAGVRPDRAHGRRPHFVAPPRPARSAPSPASSSVPAAGWSPAEPVRRGGGDARVVRPR